MAFEELLPYVEIAAFLVPALFILYKFGKWRQRGETDQEYEIPPQPSRLRKGFLVIGIALLVLGVIFFCLASRFDWDYVSTRNNNVNLSYPLYASKSPLFDAWGYCGGSLIMQPNDILAVSCSQNLQINGTLKIVVADGLSVGLSSATNSNVFASFGYPFAEGFVNYENKQPNEITVTVLLFAQNIQNVTLYTVTTLDHYERPQWVYFGIGVVISQLAVIPIFESKR